MIGSGWEVKDGLGERSDCQHARLGTIGFSAPNWPMLYDQDQMLAHFGDHFRLTLT